MLLLFLLMMIAALLEVAGIGMIPAFVSIVADPDRVLSYEPLFPVFEFLSISSSQDLLMWGSAALVAIFLMKSTYVVAFNYFEAYFINNRMYMISHRLMKSYMQAPYTFYLRRNTAELLRNTTQEVRIFINVVFTNLLTIARESVMTVAILLMLMVMEPLITLLVLIFSGFGTGTFLFLTQKRVKEYGEQEQGHRRNMIKAVNQGLGGIKDARVLNREPDFIEKFRVEIKKSSRLSAYIRHIKQIPKPVVETTAVIAMMMIAGVMVLQGRPMGTIIPILTLFAMATVRLMPAVQQISSMYTKLRYNLVTIDPIYEDLKELEEHNRRFELDRMKKEPLELKKAISVSNLTYSYPETEEQALSGVTFTIPKGGAVAFVGSSGAGKTTLVDLILGLLEPTAGEILVDGKNINNHLSAWQRNIGYIPQSIYLADDTLRKNIAFGLPDKSIDDEKIMHAIELSQLSELLSRLPKGLDTMIGEHGTRLSGGQRQRVGIARALYHNPQILVMDEATSALDNVTEKLITEAIERLKGERTIIMIAHRLSTVRKCDKLFLMSNGIIKDSGTYDQLVEKNREFREMALVT